MIENYNCAIDSVTFHIIVNVKKSQKLETTYHGVKKPCNLVKTMEVINFSQFNYLLFNYFVTTPNLTYISKT